MENSDTVVLAQVTLLRQDEGGRHSPLVGGSSYRPNHNFWPNVTPEKGMAVGIMNLSPNTHIEPGESFRVKIIFLYWQELAAELYPGREWVIQEGAKVVGRGRILELCPDR